MELGWKYPKRKAHLDEIGKTPSTETYGETFQGEFQQFGIHRVPIGLPKYRLNNGRTYAAQSEYLSRHKNLPKEFFTADPESEEAIRIQHDILKAMVSEKGLLAHFKRNKQTQPIILTSQGFVLNGNRRLCAMRELYELDGEKYAHFSHIRIIILPPADERDLDELEAKLQIHKDIKADYSWVTFALMLQKRQATHQYTAEQLADLYNLKKKEVLQYLDMLSYADAYLEGKGQEGEYHLVSRDEFAFRQIQAKKKKLRQDEDKELFVKLSFALIDEAEGGRVYSYIPAMVQTFEKIKDSLAENLGVKAPAHVGSLNLLDVADNRNELVVGAEASILALLDAEENRKLAQEVIVDVVQSDQARRKESKKRSYVLDQTRMANTALADAVQGLAAASKVEGIDKQLDAIDALVTKLRDWLHG